MKKTLRRTIIVLGGLALCRAAIGASFAETPSYQIKLPCPLSVAFSDLNGDEKKDMLINVYGEGWKDSKILMYYNKDGHFPEKADRTIPTPYCHQMAIYDFDQDAKNDIAMVGDGKSLCFLLNKNDFDPTKKLKFFNVNQSNGHAAQVCKINDKGDFDVLVGQVWRKFFRLKSGDFRVTAACVLGPRSADTGTTLAVDVDSDGAMDIVGRGRGDNTLRVYYGPLLCVRTVDPRQLREFLTLKIPGDLSGFAIGDLNGDKLNDLVVTDAENRKTYLYYQDQPVGFDADAKPSLTINGGGVVYVEDLNNDNLADLIILDNAANIAVFLQKKGAAFPDDTQKADQNLKIPKSDFLCFADVNDDGAKDMAVKNSYGQVQIYLGVTPTAK